MRKIISLLLLVGFISTNLASVWALSVRSRSSSENTPIATTIIYPVGEDFIRLKSLIDSSFSPKQDLGYNYQANCIANGTLCPNYKYTSIDEKAIKLIVLKSYRGNESFFDTFFDTFFASSLTEISVTASMNRYRGVRYILSKVPKGNSVMDWMNFDFGNSLGWELLDASFGIDFTENASTSTMLWAIEQKVKDLKRQNCQKVNQLSDSYTLCPYNGDISNQYLPTQDELFAETIYLNRGSVKISSLKDEFEYTINTTIENQKITSNSGEIITQNTSVISGYTLRYKKDSYTLEEAKAELEKKTTPTEEFLLTSNDSRTWDIPCRKYTTYLVRSQCTAALAALRDVQTSLMAYNIDTTSYPIDINKLSPSYLPKFPQEFTENFSYKHITNTWGQSDYEIRYIGHIGESDAGSGNTTNKKDYIAMMSGATVPDIPRIFAHVPSDSMVLYVRNPANLLDILNQKSNTSQRLSGIDASESIKWLMKTFFELEKFDQIQKNLKHEMAVVVNNLDATAPDIVIILSESDRAALSPTAKARVVGSKDWYIYIASSKDSLESVMNTQIEKSLKNAPDFHYVWWKKSTLVKDALVFVWDEFFAKMLTLETYITHYRKYRDYARLTSLQELAWAYSDAFGKLPTGLDQLTTLWLSTLTGVVLSEYSIADGLVTHKNIGTLQSIKTLPEARYNLSNISRGELEDYKYNILAYRDIWRSSLDPMGIVLNRFGDGMEIDFFMTPIPSSPDRDLMQMQQMFEWTTKDTLSFITNPHIRMGLVSFVWGFDPQKFQTKIKSNEEIWREFTSFSKEILDGKNIFDYLAWEFAWSIGSFDPDIFEGWNLEKVDAYISVQVATEAKWKELIEMLKKKFIAEVSGGSNTESSMFSMLAKPLIEDYQWKKIYYVEAIPVPWVGKIGIAYTFVDDFFIIGLNRSTIKHVIDTAKSGDIRKQSMVTTDSFEKWTFFATLFDGVTSSTELKRMYEKNQTIVPKILNSTFRVSSSIRPLLASYYATEDRNKHLGLKPTSLQYTLGSLTFSGMSENLSVKIDPTKLTSLSGATLEMWESLKKNPTFPPALLTEQGVPLEVFLAFQDIWDIISLNMVVQLDSALSGSESLLRNVTFGMNMGDDEIGFKLRVFREQDREKRGTLLPTVSSDVWIIGGLLLLLVVLGGVVWLILYKRWRPDQVSPAMPNTSPVITDSPVILSSIIPPTPMSIPDIGDSIIPLLPEVAPGVDTPRQAIDATLSTESNLVNPLPVLPEEHETVWAPLSPLIAHSETLPEVK